MIDKIFLLFILIDEDENKFIYSNEWYKKLFDLPENQFKELFRMIPLQFLEVRNKLFFLQKTKIAIVLLKIY